MTTIWLSWGGKRPRGETGQWGAELGRQQMAVALNWGGGDRQKRIDGWNTRVEVRELAAGLVLQCTQEPKGPWMTPRFVNLPLVSACSLLTSIKSLLSHKTKSLVLTAFRSGWISTSREWKRLLGALQYLGGTRRVIFPTNQALMSPPKVTQTQTHTYSLRFSGSPDSQTSKHSLQTTPSYPYLSLSPPKPSIGPLSHSSPYPTPAPPPSAFTSPY